METMMAVYHHDININPIQQWVIQRALVNYQLRRTAV